MEEKKDEMRKGPWTEQEDVQLVFYVNLFGDRRWDFVAKVSGLKRTGKSCRLRWVNYLHPGLKKGKMTPHEERLVLQLHNKYGNRWSRIAQKLPGRTDNEIKNYWRTYMRKKAQENKKSAAPLMSPSSSYSNSSSSSTTYNSSSMEFNLPVETPDRSSYNTDGLDGLATAPGEKKNGLVVEESTKFYSLDEIWKDIELSEENISLSPTEMAPPIWDSCTDHNLWFMDEGESTKFPFCNHMIGYQESSFI